jgi:hypothetical protein
MFILSVSVPLAPWPNTFEESILTKHARDDANYKFMKKNAKRCCRLKPILLCQPELPSLAKRGDRKMAETVGAVTSRLCLLAD